MVSRTSARIGCRQNEGLVGSDSTSRIGWTAQQSRFTAICRIQPYMVCVGQRFFEDRVVHMYARLASPGFPRARTGTDRPEGHIAFRPHGPHGALWPLQDRGARKRRQWPIPILRPNFSREWRHSRLFSWGPLGKAMGLYPRIKNHGVFGSGGRV